MSNLLRTIPAVDTFLADSSIQKAAQGLSSSEITQLIRSFLDRIRLEITASQIPLSYEEISTRLATHLKNQHLRRFQTVINATGVLLHTNLGRAPLPEEALQRLARLGRAYFNLELDLDTGSRGSRYASVARLFNLLIQKEEKNCDTIVVNNNAGAVLVTLKALAAGSEVLVSRGQLVEIGGGFRVPEVMAASGCLLKEVGTTNRTRLADYERAITPQTKAILLVHPSNYQIIGFTETVERTALAKLAEKHDLLLIEDIGSGAFPPFDEPLVPTALKASHIVTYSGDKLLGASQAGIISGRADLIAIIKKEPLLRALRIDKLSLLILESVLELYLNKDYASLPLWSLASKPADELKKRSLNWLEQLGPGLEGEVLPSASTMGGGSLPGETIPSWALILTSPHLSEHELAEWLRRGKPPVLGRVVQGRLWLDPRTVLPDQDRDLLEILRKGVEPCS